jgi:integrase
MRADAHPPTLKTPLPYTTPAFCPASSTSRPLGNFSSTADERTINMEVDCLSRAVGREWRVLWPTLKRLEEPKDVGRALSRVEEQGLLEHAAKSRSLMVLPFLRIALLTGMRFGEIRNLRWNQIDLDKRTLTVGRAKTVAGTGRPIPMSLDLYSTFAAHAGWIAQKLAPIVPAWYVSPSQTACARLTQRGPLPPSRVHGRASAKTPE